MTKATTKKEKFNHLVVEELSIRYGLTAYYVKQCITGRRQSTTADTIRKEYGRIKKEVENALSK